jgi:flagellar M-ring protein FliF
VGETIWWAGEKVEQLIVRIAISDRSGNQTVRQFSLEPVDPRVDQAVLAKELGKAMLFLMLTLIVVFGVVRPAIKSIGAQPKAPLPQPLPAPAPAPQLSAPEEPSTPLAQIRQLAKDDPATVANVVKAWVGEAK